MKIFKRLLVILTVICVCFSLLFVFSCENEDSGNTIDISSYVIVVPENASTSVKYASENLASLINEKIGITLDIVDDSSAEVENEILIGATNRDESSVSAVLDGAQYLLFEKNGKIVMQGNGIYVGAACGAFINEYADLNGSAEIDISRVPTSESVLTYTPCETAKSVIFMIGDGMGKVHVEMAEENGLDGFVGKEFLTIGTAITRSQSVLNGEASYTDSAASGTALSTGYKTINGYVGIDKDQNVLLNVRELAHSMGAGTGVITTDVITGATPSSFMCHHSSRDDSEVLQEQIDALIEGGKIDYCKGDVGNSLTNEIKSALNLLVKDDSFFLMVEEGLIDKASHNKDAENAIKYVIRFDDAIEYATQFALCHPDVALIVTADHETGKLTKNPLKENDFRFLSYQHTNVDVGVYALGAGVSIFNEQRVENIELAKFCASVYSNEKFGQDEVTVNK